MKSLTRLEKAGAFCKGLIRGKPLVEVSSTALAKGAEGEERLRHMERIANGGNCEQIAALLSGISSATPYRGMPSVPEDLQRKLAEGYVRASDARVGHGDLASSPFILTSLASTVVLTAAVFTGGILPLAATGVGVASTIAAMKIPESVEKKRNEDRRKASELALPLCGSARAVLERMKP